jgi:16S rRNA (cytidine1402-2'-O)-methyltransferase
MNDSALYIVATPIGNRNDLTLRAIEVLQSVNVIAVEDTRHSKRLLTYHQIRTPMISLHEHNESQRVQSILDRLSQGEQVALISDAGTPLICDPGFRLVAAAQEQGYRVVPIPGACAVIVALCASGLATDRFVFEGFLPAKSAARKKALSHIAQETRTTIWYESTHRIIASLTDMVDVLGASRRMTLARELTKTFETIRLDTLAGLLAWIQADPNQQKGEFVLVLEGQIDHKNQLDDREPRRILSILLQEMPLKQAVALAVRLCHQSRKSLYQLALELKQSQEG